MSIVLIDSGMGVLPFIKEILIQNKKNHYIIYLDETNFPYGNKSIREVFLCYKNIVEKAKMFSPSKIFIACNTLSTFIDKKDDKIDDILSLNLSLKPKEAYLISTYRTYSYLKSKNINKVIYLKELASLIEKNNIKEIISLIKNTRFPSQIVLSCTHYPLIKNLFIRYGKCKVYSYEDKAVSLFNESNEMKIEIYTNKKEIYKKYFIDIDIKYISLT